MGESTIALGKLAIPSRTLEVDLLVAKQCNSVPKIGLNFNLYIKAISRNGTFTNVLD